MDLDIDVKVHVSAFANNHEWARAGIMLRSDNSPDATNVFNCLSGNNGIYPQLRRSKGRWTDGSGGHYNPNPRLTSTWLRLVKKVKTVEYYRSDTGLDGDWILLTTDTIFFPEDKYRVGLAVTSRGNNLAEATFEDYEIAAYNFPTSAPSNSLAPTSYDMYADIGEPYRQGEYSVSPDGSIDYVKGSGTGIWGTSDQFFFYNEQMPNGDLSVELYINKFDNHYLHSRGGIMIRDSVDEGAANVFVGAAGYDQGVVFQSRSVGGMKTVHHKMIFINWTNTFWVRLEKVGSITGSTFTAYYKVEEGDDWIVLGDVSATFTGTHITVGRAVTAGDDHQWAQVTLETGGVAVTSS